MQDGARPHRSKEVFQLLNHYFKEKVIALDYNNATQKGLDWPPYSPDLNPCDFFLWGYIKDKVYKNNPKTMEELQNAIREEFSTIQPDLLKKVTDNFIVRIRHVISTSGAPFERTLS